jgi:uncharacterized protein with NRDE domain
MCLILFAYRRHPNYPLVLAANRDEFYMRPTAAMDQWPDHPNVLAGRDLEGMGTWMGITRSGRLAAVTNYRDPQNQKAGAPSRGHLVSDFLISDIPPQSYLNSIKGKGQRYNGFNLLVRDPDNLWYYSNKDASPRRLEAGVYGVSNHLLNTPWPKVKQGRRALEDLLGKPTEGIDCEELFGVLENQATAPDHLLPQTGVGYEWEKILSATFISSPTYGTRSSTLLLINIQGEVTIIERTWQPAQPTPVAAGTRQFTFTIQHQPDE